MIEYELTLIPKGEEPRRPASRFTGTVSPRTAAQQLRAVADELDPPQPSPPPQLQYVGDVEVSGQVLRLYSPGKAEQ